MTARAAKRPSGSSAPPLSAATTGSVAARTLPTSNSDRSRRRIDTHREFFYVTPAEVREAIGQLGTQYLLEYNEDIDAPEWRQSGGPERAILPT
jgi:hypothetical protein